MHLDAAPGSARPISPATWCALTLLILLLGTLSFFLIGCDRVFNIPELPPPCPPGQVKVGDECQGVANHYTCECDCTNGFSIGAGIQAALDANIRQVPAGDVIGLAPAGSQGTILDGPQLADLGGVTETWWLIRWDPALGLPDGWTRQPLLSVLSSGTLVQKDFEVCLPPALNANLGGTPPSPTDLINDCTVRVESHLGTLTGQTLPPGAACTCAAKSVPSTWAAECDAACTDPTTSDPVCLVAGSDPDQATPDPMSAGVFATTTVCQIPVGTPGTATVKIGGHAPKVQPKVRGVIQIQGRPCPAGQGCQVGLSYQLKFDDIEFDSGTIFADDPKFVDISVTGATQPNSVNLGFLLFNLGSVDAGTALSSAQGRRSTSTATTVALIRNTQSLAFAIDWPGKSCRLFGPLGGKIQGDQNEGTLDIDVNVDLNGVIVNQPPVANAGQDRTVQCTSPAGAQVTLDGSHSTDADNNIAFYIWRRNSDTGPLVGDPSPAPTRTTRQGLGQTKYVLRVVDDNFAADSASVNVNVVDTTAPAIDCHVPATITPPAAPLSFKATATDTCGPPPPVVVNNVQCFHVKPNGGLEDASSSCKVETQGDTVTIRNTGGVNGIIRWLARATDGAGNVGQRTCEVRVVNPGR